MFSWFGSDSKKNTDSTVAGTVQVDPVNAKLDEAMSAIDKVKSELANLKTSNPVATGGGRRHKRKTSRKTSRRNKRRSHKRSNRRK